MDAIATRRHAKAVPFAWQRRRQCAACLERLEPVSGSCYCGELERRRAYDEARRRKGLIALYRPPSMR